MERKFKVGDKVRVMDPGLLALQRFAPPGVKPNNEGTISELMEDGYYEIEFPLSGENHSQVAPYPEHQIRLIK